MIKILQDWNEIGEATLFLKQQKLPQHKTVEKNWDHYCVSLALQNIHKKSRILDFGMGNGYTLDLFDRLGFKNIFGIDLNISLAAKITTLKILVRNNFRHMPKINRGDMMATVFATNSFDFITSISAIEHGVSIDFFLKEAYRILKPSGHLFITTDYWESEVPGSENKKAYNLPWTIFTRQAIRNLLVAAKQIGFQSPIPESIPTCSAAPILWNDCRYTFLAIELIKE